METRIEHPMRIDTEHFLFREVHGEMLVLNIETDEYFTLNSAGSQLFQMVEKGKTRSEMIAHLVSRYPAVSSPQLERDVDAFLRDLAESGIIRGRTAE